MPKLHIPVIFFSILISTFYALISMLSLYLLFNPQLSIINF